MEGSLIHPFLDSNFTREYHLQEITSTIIWFYLKIGHPWIQGWIIIIQMKLAMFLELIVHFQTCPRIILSCLYPIMHGWYMVRFLIFTCRPWTHVKMSSSAFLGWDNHWTHNIQVMNRSNEITTLTLLTSYYFPILSKFAVWKVNYYHFLILPPMTMGKQYYHFLRFQ